mmetsp:Transcript_10730/g.22491  ORF Transcript_10730/g.22491 Transcript_10730/m.22491 type:complete len:143 (-) Transcript_10730:334-762(-)|eukprot:CAMPEP_0183317548 /NCGR_PEP_ID=MMETSP0160_2-20130417/58220_1 /TAXON_ID=2839 ORGANISM="Odontella Sinensis, Strain Grunow 1884" /NCGR_SAMPLE_ID=MMETSP0160_2 /ASSEMBLY_ACC=CAM_ASM_000250 /LENGTH=142 /DNA_ID=CAMNT_0025483591 /DNA_START=114 /DNA_END=542 /DNA_ORIENTATION=-
MRVGDIVQLVLGILIGSAILRPDQRLPDNDWPMDVPLDEQDLSALYCKSKARVGRKGDGSGLYISNIIPQQSHCRNHLGWAAAPTSHRDLRNTEPLTVTSLENNSSRKGGRPSLSEGKIVVAVGKLIVRQNLPKTFDSSMRI